MCIWLIQRLIGKSSVTLAIADHKAPGAIVLRSIVVQFGGYVVGHSILLSLLPAAQELGIEWLTQGVVHVFHDDEQFAQRSIVIPNGRQFDGDSAVSPAEDFRLCWHGTWKAHLKFRVVMLLIRILVRIQALPTSVVASIEACPHSD